MGHIIYPSQHTSEGDGAAVNRLFPLPGRLMHYDPFVLWDDFRIGPGAGFPAHAHRGFEAITYLFQGSIRHEDNLGNASSVSAGGAQCFTAGKGIVHSEMPGIDGECRGIQLWINLPQRLKTIDPDYQAIPAGELPVQTLPGCRVRTIAGAGSPLRLHTAVTCLDIGLEAGAEYTADQPAEGEKGFIYISSGALTVAGSSVPAGSACFLEAGTHWSVQATKDSRFILCTGQPHNEPIRQHGGFVD